MNWIETNFARWVVVLLSGALSLVVMSWAADKTPSDVGQRPNVNVVTYSRTRGVFAGTNIMGSSITQDEDDTRALYSSPIPLSDILKGTAQPTAGGDSLVNTVRKYAGEAKPRD